MSGFEQGLAIFVGVASLAGLVAGLALRPQGSRYRGCCLRFLVFAGSYLLSAFLALTAYFIHDAPRARAEEEARQQRVAEHVARVERPIVASVLPLVPACRKLPVGQRKTVVGDERSEEYAAGYWSSAGPLRLRGAPLVWRLAKQAPVTFGDRLASVPGVGHETPLARTTAEPVEGPVTVFLVTDITRQFTGSGRWMMKGGSRIWTRYGYEDRTEVCVFEWPARRIVGRLVITGGSEDTEYEPDLKDVPDFPSPILADIILKLAVG